MGLPSAVNPPGYREHCSLNFRDSNSFYFEWNNGCAFDHFNSILSCFFFLTLIGCYIGFGDHNISFARDYVIWFFFRFVLPTNSVTLIGAVLYPEGAVLFHYLFRYDVTMVTLPTVEAGRHFIGLEDRRSLRKALQLSDPEGEKMDCITFRLNIFGNSFDLNLNLVSRRLSRAVLGYSLVTVTVVIAVLYSAFDVIIISMQDWGLLRPLLYFSVKHLAHLLFVYAIGFLDYTIPNAHHARRIGVLWLHSAFAFTLALQASYCPSWSDFLWLVLFDASAWLNRLWVFSKHGEAEYSFVRTMKRWSRAAKPTTVEGMDIEELHGWNVTAEGAAQPNCIHGNSIILAICVHSFR